MTPTPPQDHRAHSCRVYSRVAGTIVILIPCIVLAGWITDNETLKRIQPGLTAMNPVTAVNFILAGLSLYLLQGKGANARWAARALGGVIALVGLLSLG